MYILQDKKNLLSYLLNVLPNSDLTPTDIEKINSWDDVKKFSQEKIFINSDKKAIKTFNKKFSNNHYPVISLKEMVKKYVFF